METFINVVKSIGKFIYALFFTREDDLDILQLLFASMIVVTLMIVWELFRNTAVPEAVLIEALKTLRWMIGLLIVTAVPKWLVPYITKQNTKEQETEDVHSSTN